MKDAVQLIVNLITVAWGAIFEYILIKSRLNPWGFYMAQEPNDLVFLLETGLIIPAVVACGLYLAFTTKKKEETDA